MLGFYISNSSQMTSMLPVQGLWGARLRQPQRWGPFLTQSSTDHFCFASESFSGRDRVAQRLPAGLALSQCSHTRHLTSSSQQTWGGSCIGRNRGSERLLQLSKDTQPVDVGNGGHTGQPGLTAPGETSRACSLIRNSRKNLHISV